MRSTATGWQHRTRVPMQHGGGFIQRQKAAPIKNNAAGCDAPWLRNQPHDRKRECGFAATAFPVNAKGSALGYPNIHTIQRGNIARHAPEYGAQAVLTQQWRCLFHIAKWYQ
jgi:hypothetical protein